MRSPHAISCYVVLGGLIMLIPPYSPVFFVQKKSSARSKCPRSLVNQVAVQMNDTHPTIAVAEMMRLLVPLRKGSIGECLNLVTLIKLKLKLVIH